MEDIDKFYNLEYEAFIKNGIVGLGSDFTHWSLERSSNWWGLLKLSNKDLAILEVGAGNGQHLNFVKPDYYSYEMIDLRPEMLPNNFKHATVNRNSVSAETLPYPNQSFDRLIATCLLAHLNEPQDALREWKRVLKQNGLITIYVPCEPGIFLRALRAIVTNPKKEEWGSVMLSCFSIETTDNPTCV